MQSGRKPRLPCQSTDSSISNTGTVVHAVYPFVGIGGAETRKNTPEPAYSSLCLRQVDPDLRYPVKMAPPGHQSLIHLSAFFPNVGCIHNCLSCLFAPHRIILQVHNNIIQTVQEQRLKENLFHLRHSISLPDEMHLQLKSLKQFDRKANIHSQAL